MDPTFTEVDQRFVLGEIIKASDLDVGTLVDFICKHNVQPNWVRMQLPCGRNLLQVWKAAEVMFNAPLNPPPTAHFATLKRKSIGDLNEHGSKRLATSPIDQSTPPLPPIMHAPQPQHVHSPLNATRNVSIQPRPASNGYQQSPTAAPPPMTPALPQSIGRKRGRPSKADKEAQARANGSAAPMPGAPLPSLAPHPVSQHLHAPSPPNNSPAGGNTGTQSRYITGHDPYAHSPSSRGPFAPNPAEDASRGSASVRWRDPMTVASHLPTGEKRDLRAVSDSLVQRASAESRSIERPERSPSVSNLITPTDDGGGMSGIAGHHSPVAQSVAARHAIYGNNGSTGTQSTAEHENRPVSGHERRTQTPVSNAA
ncbi:hypothetical protein MCOR25_001610 [Pyricularia grisea]|nr:hypothetical protein MCOR25_001610 [Pyricularia grisea]